MELNQQFVVSKSNASKNSERKRLGKKLKNLIERNDIERLDELLSVDKNYEVLKENRFFCPFTIAIKANHLHLFEYFQRKGFKLRGKHKRQSSSDCENKQPTTSCSNTISETNCMALIEAIKCLNVEAVDLLIKLNVNVNSSNYKYVPLQIAYNCFSAEKEKQILNRYHNPERLEKSLVIFKKLLTSKANPNIYNNKGYRLIHQIILNKDLDTLELLINYCESSLKINLLTYGKMFNCLHLVSETKKRLNPTDPDNRNWMNDKQIMNDLNLKLAVVLIKAGCNMNHKDYQLRETPVFKAILMNYYELVKLFLVEGFDMSCRNIYGNDVLSRSIQLGRYKIARLLIAADSPIRVYSCFYKIPSIDEIQSNNSSALSVDYATEDEDFYSAATLNNENFLQYSLLKYEEFLQFIQRYTREPRSLVDLSRLCVRNEIKKPISKWLTQLNVPRQIQDLIMLKDI